MRRDDDASILTLVIGLVRINKSSPEPAKLGDGATAMTSHSERGRMKAFPVWLFSFCCLLHLFWVTDHNWITYKLSLVIFKLQKLREIMPFQASSVSKRIQPSCGLFCLFSLYCLLPTIEATIIVGDHHFTSMPAVFGKPFSLVGSDDTAHLQLLPENPFLCNSMNNNNSLKERRHLKGSSNDNEETNQLLPPDGLPVAVLTSRGACSFEEKARVAMEYDYIKYVIVHDDRARSALVPMSAANPDNITIGMLFTSHTSGMLLRRMILEEAQNVTDQGGLVIIMDAKSPPMPPDYNQTQQWMLAAMGGFFTFMACFGCLLIGIHAGYVPADGRIVIDRNGIRPAVAPSSRRRRRLLTEAQVHCLPHEEYAVEETKDDDHNHTAACAICIEEYQPGDVLYVLPCEHRFHADCIVPWLTERQASCPLCKQDITAEDLMEEEADEVARGGEGMRWFWSWRRSDRTIVPTEEQDEGGFETPPGSPSRRLEEHTPPITPLSPSEETDTEAMVPRETS